LHLLVFDISQPSPKNGHPKPKSNFSHSVS
jgi:hypothetical protein